MSFVGRTRQWLRAVGSRKRLEREMRDEMNAHLQQAAERFRARGMSEADAQQAARREFGHRGSIEQSAREARGARLVTSVGEGTMSTLFTPFVERVLHGSSQDLGLIVAAQAIGGIAGGMVAAASGHRFRASRLMC